MDAILAEHKDQQERVAEEMIALTRSLKEQSAAAGSLIRKDTAKLGQVDTEHFLGELLKSQCRLADVIASCNRLTISMGPIQLIE